MMRRTLLTALGAVALVAVLVLLLRFALRSPVSGERAARATLSLDALLGSEDTAGYARAFAPRPFDFPRDHGAHPEFRTEWWYLTGNLETASGRRFGYQLTFFRNALAPAMPARESAWAARQAWMAHFALTDVAGGRFHAYERFARDALELAGARTWPFRVWLGDWSMETAPFAADTIVSADAGLVGDAVFPLRLVAGDGDAAIELEVAAGKPLVLQGEHGLSRKGEAPGNASFYYSFTRLPTRGRIRVGADTLEVTGASWLDREWSTSGLTEDVEGWDWFALQLSDSTELMFYRLRRADGGTDPYSAGTFVDARGGTTSLAAGDVTIETLATWQSPVDGLEWPARWRLVIPRLDATFEIEPVLPGQELDLSVRYWEGAVDVRGTRAGRPVLGRGYVEQTGYQTRTSPDRATVQSLRSGG